MPMKPRPSLTSTRVEKNENKNSIKRDSLEEPRHSGRSGHPQEELGSFECARPTI